MVQTLCTVKQAIVYGCRPPPIAALKYYKSDNMYMCAQPNPVAVESCSIAPHPSFSYGSQRDRNALEAVRLERAGLTASRQAAEATRCVGPTAGDVPPVCDCPQTCHVQSSI